jgi:hypothetical protein
LDQYELFEEDEGSEENGSTTISVVNLETKTAQKPM